MPERLIEYRQHHQWGNGDERCIGSAVGKATRLDTIVGALSVSAATTITSIWMIVLSLAAGSASGTTYRLTDLGATIAGTQLSPGFPFTSSGRSISINASGQVTVTLVTPIPSLQGYLTRALLFDGSAMRDLGTLGGPFASAAAINDSGKVTGTSATATTVPNGFYEGHAFVWDGSVMRDLGTLGGSFSDGVAINDSGEVTGSSTIERALVADPPSSVYVRHAFVWDGSVMKDLGTLGGPSQTSEGSAINSSGQVTGYSSLYSDAVHAFLWDGSAMQDLGTLGGGPTIGGGGFSIGLAINASGWVMGNSSITSPNFVQHAFVWNGSDMIDLGSLGESSWGTAMNASGQVTGYSEIIADSGVHLTHAFFWDGSAMQDLGTLSGTTSLGAAINASGQVVGTSTTTKIIGYSHASDPPIPIYEQRAFLWDGTAMQDLNALIESADPLRPSVLLSSASDINDAGQIVALGVDSSTNQQRSYLVSPSPPAAPTGLTATERKASIDLAWSDNSDDEVGFRVDRRVGSGTWSQIAITPENATSYIDSNVSRGTIYAYQVSALGRNTSSTPSSSVTAQLTKDSGGSGSFGVELVPLLSVLLISRRRYWV